MLEARGFEFSESVQSALAASGFANVKALKSLEEDDIEEIKRFSSDVSAFRLGDARQLQQLCVEVTDKENEFLADLKEFKKKNLKRRRDPSIVEIERITPIGKIFYLIIW